MPLLVYCVIETPTVVQVLCTGVNGVPIKILEHSGLQCLVSQSNDTVRPAAGAIRDSALTFHQVLDEVFKQAAIIPFRFPTILSSETEVTAHLAEHSAEYRSALTRLRNMVQMEVGLQFKASPPIPDMTGSVVKTTKPSGTHYLQRIQARHAKLETAAKNFREACAALTRGWKQRDSAGGVRCFALIERNVTGEFQKTLAGAKIESDLVARLSGPWPATQFLKEE